MNEWTRHIENKTKKGVIIMNMIWIHKFWIGLKVDQKSDKMSREEKKEEPGKVPGMKKVMKVPTYK